MAQADPTEDLETPTPAQVIKLAIETRLEELHTFSWGSVLSYDKPSQTCSVQIIPRRHFVDLDGEMQTERPAPLLSVPVVFPGSGVFSMTWPVAPGDVVLLAFTETALDAWTAGGQTDVDSGDSRKHHITDAIAIPGLRPRTAPISPSGTDDSATVIAAPMLRLGDSSASEAPAFNSDLLAVVNAILGCTPSGTESGLTAIKTALASYATTPPAGAANVTVK